MPYTYQLQDAMDSLELQEVAGCCPDTPEFVSLVNTVQRLFWKRGDWVDSEWLIRFCVYSACITWPRYLSAIRGARSCCFGNIAVRNNWWSMIGAWHRGLAGFGCDLVLEDVGTAPIYNDPTAPGGGLIQYHVVKPEDYGKTITLFGKKYGAQPLQEKDTNGNWKMGTTIIAANPDARTTVNVTQIGSVVRQCTSGMAYLYEYNPADGTLRDLAVYEPQESNPRYQRSIVRNWCSTERIGQADAYGRHPLQLEVLAKLAFIPVVCPQDFLFVDSIDALKLGMQAVKAGNAADIIGREAFLNAGIKELNFDLRDKNGTNITVNVNPVGRTLRGVH